MSKQNPPRPWRIWLLAAAGILVILALVVGWILNDWAVIEVGLYMLTITAAGVMANFAWELFNAGRRHAKQRKRQASETLR